MADPLNWQIGTAADTMPAGPSGEMADATDLKSVVSKEACGFDSRLGQLSAVINGWQECSYLPGNAQMAEGTIKTLTDRALNHT